MRRPAGTDDKAKMAAFMSGLVIPGAGQFYNGDRGKGVLFGAIEVLVLAAVLLIFAGKLFVHIAGMARFEGVMIPPFLRFFGDLSLGWIAPIAFVYILNRVASVWDAYRSAPHAGR